jgi:hypothetical protein
MLGSDTYSFTYSSLPGLRFDSSLFVYATNARPDREDWGTKGGEVYIVAKHSGAFPYPAPGYDILLHVGGRNPTSPVLQNDGHQPRSPSSHDGSGNYTCTYSSLLHQPYHYLTPNMT